MAQNLLEMPNFNCDFDSLFSEPAIHETLVATDIMSRIDHRKIYMFFDVP